MKVKKKLKAKKRKKVKDLARKEKIRNVKVIQVKLNLVENEQI